MKHQPLIGITTTVRTVVATGHTSYATYAPNITAVEQAGGLPILIPVGLNSETLRAIYERLDGVLLPGGGDIDPVNYGEERHPLTSHIDVLRDETEIAVARWAVADDLPLFGICRGHQLINVALGGTLIQDIPSEVGETLTHDTSDKAPRGTRPHSVEINPSSQLSQIIGLTHVEVNSIHHQAVEKPASDLCVTAYAADGVIEAAEIPGKRFALTVQWHPEDLVSDDPAMRRLFSAFVDAASHS